MRQPVLVPPVHRLKSDLESPTGRTSQFPAARDPSLPRAHLSSVALCGGGTAGHVMTGLALAESLHDRGTRVTFVGGKDGFESRLMGPAPCQLHAVDCGPLARSDLVGGAIGLLRLAHGVVQARRILAEVKPQVAVGVGCYASAPGILAAKSLGIPVALVETNAVMGLANKLLAPLANRLYLGPLTACNGLRRGRFVTVGVPLRQAVLDAMRLGPPLRTAQRSIRVLVTGGSLGADFLDGRVPSLLSRLQRSGIKLEVTHQVCQGHVPQVRAAYEAASLQARVFSFSPDFEQCMRRADLAIVSPGAVTLAELCAYGIPSVVIPDTRVAWDHHSDNVRAFAPLSGCIVESAATWNEDSLVDRISALLTDPIRWREAAQRMRSLAWPSGGSDLVRDLEMHFGVTGSLPGASPCVDSGPASPGFLDSRVQNSGRPEGLSREPRNPGSEGP